MAYLLPRAVHWTNHALERWQVHWPRHTGHDMLGALSRGTEESPDLVTALTGRAQTSAKDTKYVMAEDRRGIFVLVQVESGAWQVRTYLRLGEHQRAVAAGETVEGSVAQAAAQRARRRAALLQRAEETRERVRNRKQPSFAEVLELAEGAIWLLGELGDQPQEGRDA